MVICVEIKKGKNMLDLRTTKEIVKILGEYILDKTKTLYNFTTEKINWKLFLFWIFLGIISYVYIFTGVPIILIILIPIMLVFIYVEAGIFILLYYLILLPLPFIIIDFGIVDSKLIKKEERIISISKYVENHEGYFMVSPEYEFISVTKKTFYRNKDKRCSKIKRYKEVREPINISKDFSIEKDVFLECIEYNKIKG